MALITARMMKIAEIGGCPGTSRITSTMMKIDTPDAPISAIGPYFAPTTNGSKNSRICTTTWNAATARHLIGQESAPQGSPREPVKSSAQWTRKEGIGPE
ncbi:hypothetical protein MUG78_10815 [Gordonia alkaliphila]|nr:hypothetical protein [Gordonia alkaliphila]